MPQTFKVKNSSVEAKVPAAGDLATAELALNLKDQKLYSKDADGNVFEIGEAEDLSNYLEKGDNVSELTNDAGYITVDEVPKVTGFVKLDDEGTKQDITGGGGLGVVGGITSEFGTSAAQLGNVAPLNDWSCYPARTIIRYSQPVPPAPLPEPIDPEFGVEEPTFSGVATGSAGMVGTQDIIDLEGE
jgi:hypothetical protein